jgi:hypothetical protein
VKENDAKGTITFEVRGTNATPVTSLNGDSSVDAKFKGNVVASDPVIVIVPAAIGTPHPQAKGVATPVNMALDLTTSPSYSGGKKGNVFLVCEYLLWLTVPVVDQFGNPLDSMYNGVDVTELNNVPINQKIKDGTYQDPVGPGDPFEEVEATSPVVPMYLKGQTYSLKDPNDSIVQNIAVQVGGWSLNPGVKNRTVSWVTDPDTKSVTITVTWP